MKFFYILLIPLLLLGEPLFSQNAIVKDADTLAYFIVQDVDTLHQVRIDYYAPRKKKERDCLLYLNSYLLDSSGVFFDRGLTFFNGVFRGFRLDYLNKTRKVFSLDIKNRELLTILESTSFTPRTFHYGSNSYEQIIRLESNGDTSMFADLDPHLDYLEAYKSSEGLRKIHELSSESILCETCAWGGGCMLYRYFIVREDSIQEIDFDQLRQPYNNQFDRQYEDFRVNFYFSHYDYDFLMAEVDYGNLPEDTDLIFSRDLEDTSHIIKKHQPWEIMGENIQEGKSQFFYLRSQLDNGENVIVTYKMDQAFEEIAYDIFKNHAINKEQIKEFNKDQLGILKNLVFAKYNYAFSTAFYQAYVNLFEFYRDEKKLESRTKDMNGLLTESDAKNLEVVNKAFKKFD